MVKQKRIY